MRYVIVSAGRISRLIKVVISCCNTLVLSCIHLRAQAPVHEAPFLERHPPLARFTRPISVQFLNEPRTEFLTDLYQILAKVVYTSGSINILVNFWKLT